VPDPHVVKRRRFQAEQRKDRRGDLGCLGGRAADVGIALTGQHDEVRTLRSCRSPPRSAIFSRPPV